MEEKSLMTDTRPDPDHFTMVPNFLIESPLSPAAFRVYVYIKHRTGEAIGGRCWEASRNIAKACGISTGALSKAKAELVAFNLVDIKKVSGNRPGEYPHDEIAIRDVWGANKEFYYLDKSGKQDKVNQAREALKTWRTEKGWRVPDQARKTRTGRRRKNIDAPSDRPL